MSKPAFLVKLCVLLLGCLAFIIAMVMWSRIAFGRKLEKVLAFEIVQVDACVVGPVFLGSETTTLRGGEAKPFVEHFALIIRKYAEDISQGVFEFKYTYEVTVKSNDSIWKFRFGHTPKDTLVEYKTQVPASTKGTIILDRKAGPELESLVDSVVRKQHQN